MCYILFEFYKKIMEILYKIILLISWIIYAMLDGRRDGFFYHYRNTSIQGKGENIHWIYFCQRFIFGVLIAWLVYLNSLILSTIIYSNGLILLFSFFHNGMYYVTRRKLSNKNLYPKGWWSSSTSSEALLELNNVSRIFLAITGILGIIVSLNINI